MSKRLRILYAPYQWLFFIPMVCLVTFLVGVLALILVFGVSAKFASKLCGPMWARVIGYLTPIRVKVTGRGNIEKSRSYIIAANHQSQYDIIVLYGWLGVDFKWIMKQELRKVPIIGICCEKLGHIIIDRSNHDAAVASINAAKDQLSPGTSILFFPEGTRSRDGKIGNFKKGAFRLAVDLNLPVLPVTIHGTRQILAAKSKSITPGRAHLFIHPPIEINTCRNRPEVLMEATRNVIIQSYLPG